MNTHLTLKENQEFELDVYNSESEHMFCVEGYVEIESTGVTFCVISKVTDSQAEPLDNFVTKKWVSSTIESKEEVKEIIASLDNSESYSESQTYLSNRL